MEKIKEYASYIDSEIEWLGIIPQDWSLIKLKYLCQINTGSRDTQDKKNDGDYPFFVRADNVERIDEYTHNEEAVMTAGDGVGVGKVFHYYNGKFSAHQRVYIFTKFRGSDAKFIYYYLKSNLAFEVLKGNAKSTVDSLRRPMLTEFLVSIPSLTEQKLIVKFLDKTTEEIGSLIEDKEELIELLEEKRQAIITEAVTKGLNLNVNMKDSGVEWIGEIPEHWDVKRLGYLGRTQNGISKSSDEFGFGTPFVSYSDVYRNLELPSHVEGLVNTTDSDRKTYSVKKGDVYFTRTSETIEEIGMASTCTETIKDATFAGFLIRFRPNTNKIHPEFSKYYFRSNLGRKYFVREMNIVTRASLSQDLLKGFPVLIPPAEEQIQIGEYLDYITKKIKESISSLEEQIQRLKEYRQSLIYEAVTGKIDVREYNKVLS